MRLKYHEKPTLGSVTKKFIPGLKLKYALNKDVLMGGHIVGDTCHKELLLASGIVSPEQGSTVGLLLMHLVFAPLMMEACRVRKT
jgi:hypothetical protein